MGYIFGTEDSQKNARVACFRKKYKKTMKKIQKRVC